MTPLGDPERIRHLAHAYNSTSHHLLELADRMQARVGAARWECAAARRWRDQMARDVRELRDLADDCQRVSDRLSHAADDLARELAVLHSLERAVLDVFRRFNPLDGIQPPWRGLGWHPGLLPASGDPAWRTITAHVGVTSVGGRQ